MNWREQNRSFVICKELDIRLSDCDKYPMNCHIRCKNKKQVFEDFGVNRLNLVCVDKEWNFVTYETHDNYKIKEIHNPFDQQTKAKLTC